jgi:hypothetical protein
MKKAYDSPTLVMSGEIVQSTLGTTGPGEIDASPGVLAPLGSVGFML